MNPRGSLARRQRGIRPRGGRPSRPGRRGGEIVAVRERGDVGFVRDQDDGVAGLVQAGEQRHDLGAGLRVEVAGRLVGEQDRRVVHERARDGHALALAARQLVRPVASCATSSSTFSSAALARACRSFAGTPA